MLYGRPYDTEFAVYALLLGVQWANGVGRPAFRHAVVVWDARQIRAWVRSGAIASVLLSCLAVGRYGAIAAAVASVVGAMIVSGRAFLGALSVPASQEQA